jgi:hypothetical protein
MDKESDAHVTGGAEGENLVLSFTGLGNTVKWGTNKMLRLGSFSDGEETVEIWYSFSASSAKESAIIDISLYRKVALGEPDG